MIDFTPPPLMALAAVDLHVYNLAQGPPQEGRSPQWERVRRAHVSAHPNCEACGTKDSVEVHHILAFHLYPEFELIDLNLLSLCRVHHYVFGHWMDWTSFNPAVREHAANYLLNLHNRPHSRLPGIEVTVGLAV